MSKWVALWGPFLSLKWDSQFMYNEKSHFGQLKQWEKKTNFYKQKREQNDNAMIHVIRTNK